MPTTRDAEALVASVVDVGSNSVLLLSVAVGPDGRARQHDAALATTRLGAGLDEGGFLDPAARVRTRDAVVALAARARTRGATRLWAFGTGAVRRARDGGAFATELGQTVGCAVTVLSGEDEAALAYRAVTHAGDTGDAAVLAIDVGGATTEVTLGRDESMWAAASLPLGALSLSESTSGGADVARALAMTSVPAAAREAGAVLVASGGTATALAALDLGLATYDPARVHGHVLAVSRLAELARQADGMPGVLDEGRARILPAGALVLEAVARAAGASTLRVSDHGVRHGFLRRCLATEGVDADLRALWS